MPFSIHINEPLISLLAELPRPARACLLSRLERLAEVAEQWPPGDPRWTSLAQVEAEGLRFYVADCCVRVGLVPDSRELVVRQIGRVRVALWASDPEPLQEARA